MNQLEKECLSYFQHSSIWDKVLKGFWKKYESYGMFQGAVTLKRLSPEEIDELEGFFGKNYHGQKSVTISAAKLTEQLVSSRFSSITPERLLELYFHRKPIGNKEKERNQLQRRKECLQQLKVKYQYTPAGELLDEIAQLIKCNDTTEMETWKTTLCMSVDILNHLPYREEKLVYLAVFATQITGNPHAFDNGQPGGRLLKELIHLDLCHRQIDVKTSNAFAAFKRQKSYLLAGILIDDISNYTLLYGVHAQKSDGADHVGMNGFAKEKECVPVTFASIAAWKRIECPDGKLYVVENPTIFSILCEETKKRNEKLEYPDTAVMCMNGQPRLTGLLVLELCIKSGIEVYYAGDFDPEGLLIAQKLADFCEDNLCYWHMTTQDYEKCRSKEYINDRRMKMLDRITDERLMPIVGQLQKYRTAGYQEGLAWDEFV